MSLIERLKKARLGDQGPAAPMPAPSDAPLVRRRFHFFGVVQGVGFRYEAQRIASRLELVGWVKNLGDGSVVVEIEGAANYIEAFLMTLEAVPRFDITEIRRKDLPPLRRESSFRALYEW